jgi:uncharacterized protein YecT (DUF1311 family)
MKSCVVALLLSLSTTAFANSNCDHPVNDFDGLYCMSKVFFEADKELNQNYAELVSKIDAAGKTQLKRGQLDWIKTRNRLCSRREDTQFFVNMQCVSEQTISRSEFLRSRIRECASAGCQNSKL